MVAFLPEADSRRTTGPPEARARTLRRHEPVPCSPGRANGKRATGGLLDRPAFRNIETDTGANETGADCYFCGNLSKKRRVRSAWVVDQASCSAVPVLNNSTIGAGSTDQSIDKFPQSGRRP